MMCGLLLQPDSEGEFIYTLSVQRFWDVCGAPSCRVCHWDLFLLEIFRTWTSQGWSPLLPVEDGAGHFPGPHPTTLWLLCPSRLRAGWFLARRLGCWELMCTQHSLEMHIQFSRPPELGGLGPWQAESNPCSYPRRRWPVDLPAWDNMLVPALCFSTQLSLSGTQIQACHMLWRTGKGQHPLLSISRGHSVSIPALSRAMSPATLDDLKVPPKCSVCVWASELYDGCSSVGLLPSVPSHSHPLPSCQTLQVQYLPGQRLCGPSILPWLPRFLHRLPRSDFAEHAVVYICSVPVASCRVPTSAVDRVPRGQGPASLPSSFFCF